MNHDLARRTILKYILHLLSIRYHASFGLIGFFEGGLSANASSIRIGKILNLIMN